MQVGLFIPCFVDLFYPPVGIATVQVLEHLGHEVLYPPEQTCCGQPHFNAGRWPEARSLAEKFCALFSPYSTIVCPSGSCTAMVRNHYEALVGKHPVSQRVFELCEFVQEFHGSQKLATRLPGSAVLHIGCHQRRELNAAPAVETLMHAVEGLRLVSVESESWCCGFGGTFSVKFPDLSSAMLQRKIDPILRADVDYLISTDASCLMQLGGYLAKHKLSRPKPLHVAQVLATCTEAP